MSTEARDEPTGEATASSTTGGCAEILRVLGDPTRLAVVSQLMDGPRHVGSINENLALEASLLSHHLRVLREAGLVESERDGKAVLYRLSPTLDEASHRKVLDLGCCRLDFEAE